MFTPSDSACYQRLKLNYVEQLSNLTFKMNLRRYVALGPSQTTGHRAMQVGPAYTCRP